MMRKTRIVISAVAASSIFAGASFANTCPTDLKQDKDGYWYSDTKPGWKSPKPTEKGVTISSDNFGGVVFSPKRNRIACVYKASDGKWIALVSNVYYGISIDKKASNDAGNGPAWEYSNQHEDYACGQPNVSTIEGCQFQLGDSSTSPDDTNKTDNSDKTDNTD